MKRVLNGEDRNDPEAEILDYSLVKAHTKSLSVAYFLCATLGIFGLHHFYLRRLGFGFTYMFTGGLFFVGWIIDLFRLPSVVRATNDKIVKSNRESIDLNQLEKEKLVSDAYVMCLPPFGLLGFHHFYLMRFGFGSLYIATLGLFGVGWLLDLFRMPYLVSRANTSITRTAAVQRSVEENGDASQTEELYKETQNNPSSSSIPPKRPGRKRLDDTVVLAYGPTGILGFHHFYLGNFMIGFFYVITLANCGVCWIADMFRVRSLVQKVNNEVDGRPEGQKKSVLQTYLLWLPPAGLLGAHHFYLDRPFSGLLYSVSLGLLLVGWVVDAFRIPGLVKKYNLKQELQEYIAEIELEMSPGENPQKEQNPYDVDMVNPFLKTCCP